MAETSEKIVKVSSVKRMYDVLLELIDNKQNPLSSGKNIKTINGASVLGAGNIDIGEGATDDEINDYLGLISAKMGKATFGKLKLGG